MRENTGFLGAVDEVLMIGSIPSTPAEPITPLKSPSSSPLLSTICLPFFCPPLLFHKRTSLFYDTYSIEPFLNPTVLSCIFLQNISFIISLFFSFYPFCTEKHLSLCCLILTIIYYTFLGTIN